MSGLSNFLGNVSGEKDEPDDEVLDADENFESAPPELPDLGNWFDALEDATPSVAEFPEPPSLIASAEPLANKPPTIADEPQAPVDPLAIPPPPASLVTESELAPPGIAPPAESRETEADLWLDEILSAPPTHATSHLATIAPDRWDPAHDDIIPGKVTTAAALRPVVDDDVVTDVISTETERRRGRRGRRASDDITNPVVSDDTKTRRRGRRRTGDSMSVDLPPPNGDQLVLDHALPDPNGIAATIAEPRLDDLNDSFADGLLEPPSGDPVNVAPPVADEPLADAAPVADPSNLPLPEPEADEPTGAEPKHRRRSRHKTDGVIPDIKMSSEEAADIMGLGPEVTELAPPEGALLGMPAPAEPAEPISGLPAPEPLAPPTELMDSPPVDLPPPSGGQIIGPPKGLGMRVVENPRKQRRFRRKG